MVDSSIGGDDKLLPSWPLSNSTFTSFQTLNGWYVDSPLHLAIMSFCIQNLKGPNLIFPDGVRNEMSRKTEFGSRVLSPDVVFCVNVMDTNFCEEVNSSFKE